LHNAIFSGYIVYLRLTQPVDYQQQPITADGKLFPKQQAPNAGGVGKIAFFDRSRSLRLRRFTAENLCPCATVVRVHDGALAEEYAVSSITLIVVEVCFYHAYGSLQHDIYATRSHARCEKAEPTATTRVVCKTMPNKK